MFPKEKKKYIYLKKKQYLQILDIAYNFFIVLFLKRVEKFEKIKSNSVP